MIGARLRTTAIAIAMGAMLVSGGARADALTTEATSLGISTGLNFDVTIGGTAQGRTAGSFDVTNLDTGTSFFAFCADILQSVSSQELSIVNPTGLEFTATSTLLFTGSASETQNVQALFDQRYGALNLTSQVDTAAFQIALWELIDDDGALGTGNVVWGTAAAASAQETALAVASDWLANLSDPTADDTYDLTVWETLTDPLSQPYIQATLAQTGNVPEPGTLLLGLAGLAGLGYMRRRG